MRSLQIAFWIVFVSMAAVGCSRETKAGSDESNTSANATTPSKPSPGEQDQSIAFQNLCDDLAGYAAMGLIRIQTESDYRDVMFAQTVKNTDVVLTAIKSLGCDMEAVAQQYERFSGSPEKKD